MRKSFDTAWKQLLTQFLPDFIAFAYADLAKEIDWSAPSLALEQELHRLTPRHLQGKKIVDKVFRLKHKENQNTYSFVHVEIQNKQTNFSERMARYYAWLIDRWGPRVLSVALLIDGDPNWRPNHFLHGYWDCYIDVHYRAIKLLDF